MDIEKFVLSAIFLDNEAILTVADIISLECFSDVRNRHIYEAMLQLNEQGQAIDSISVYDTLKKNKKKIEVSYISGLTGLVPSAAFIETHAKLLIEKQVQRSLLKISDEIKKDISNTDVFELLSEVERKIYQIGQNHRIKSEITIVESLTQVINDIEEIKAGKEVGLVKTGLADLDNLTGGLRNSELSVLGARPSMGKTSLACRIALNVSENHPVLIYELEMSHKALTTKLLSMESGESFFNISTARLKKEAEENFKQSITRLLKHRLIIDDSASSSIDYIRRHSRVIKAKENIRLIVVDYLQLVRAKAESREREISTISSGLKALAKELDIPILCLSQLNRNLEQRSDRRPTLADLRESGSIEQDADLVMMLYRDEYYGVDTDEGGSSTKNIAELLIRKSRNGAIGTVKLYFNHNTADFRNYLDMKTYYNDLF